VGKWVGKIAQTTGNTREREESRYLNSKDEELLCSTHNPKVGGSRLHLSEVKKSSPRNQSLEFPGHRQVAFFLIVTRLSDTKTGQGQTIKKCRDTYLLGRLAASQSKDRWGPDPTKNARNRFQIMDGSLMSERTKAIAGTCPFL